MSLTLWLWEQEKSLCWIGVQHSTWTAGVPCHPEQWKTVPVVDIRKKSMVLTGKDDEEKLNNMFCRLPAGTVLRLKQSQLCPGNEVTTFFCFCRLSHLILQDLSCLTNVFWVDERFTQVFAHLSSRYCCGRWLTERLQQSLFLGLVLNLGYETPYVNVLYTSQAFICVQKRAWACPHVFPVTLPICSALVVAQCQHTDVWPLSLQQEFVWNL